MSLRGCDEAGEGRRGEVSYGASHAKSVQECERRGGDEACQE